MGPTAPAVCSPATAPANGSTSPLRDRLSSAPESKGPNDNLRLYGVFISAVVRCAPPHNKPLPEEIQACQPYLLREWQELRASLRVILALGAIVPPERYPPIRPSPQAPLFIMERFTNHPVVSNCSLVYHPSQQNTFTGRLTWPMWKEIFEMARALME
jgi:uracil-DNA glycosylase